jgi:polyphosphate kinase
MDFHGQFLILSRIPCDGIVKTGLPDIPLSDVRRTFPRRERFRNRELSWLDFNHRVLDEARDRTVPVLERLKFMAIFASNLDEFFMVRVAFVRRQIEAGVVQKGKDGLTAQDVMKRLVSLTHHAHESLGECFRTTILPDLEREGIVLVTDSTTTEEQAAFAGGYFRSTVAPLLNPVLPSGGEFPPLENGALYFCVAFGEGRQDPDLAILRLPTPALGRFVRLPSPEKEAHIMFVDDVVRLGLPLIFPGRDIGGCFAIRIVRDSELDLDDVGSADLLKSILEGLQKRKKGPATRLLYDPDMPPGLRAYLEEHLGIRKGHSFVGARYHSFSDFMQVPSIIDRPDLLYPPMPPLPCKRLDREAPMFKEIRKRDILLQHPYENFAPVISFFEAAAEDPLVTEVCTTLYRVSGDSRIADALGRAAGNGKQVNVLIELKARFDEERNIGWARSLQEAGARVLYGVKGLKTHCKVAMVVREEQDGKRRYCHLSTGNYNDRTARVYSDFGLLTAHEGICRDVAVLFDRIFSEIRGAEFDHLLVAPEYMREAFVRRIRREADNAAAGRPSGIIAKMNSLVDTGMIDELYLASRAGVPIRLIVRGICSLRPGIPHLSDTIEVCSIIDRYLEHARVYRFENGGDAELFLASADWMPRNLDGRIETAFPILDPGVRRHIETVLELQLTDTTKARLLTSNGSSVRREGPRMVRAQYEQYELARAGL